MKLDVRKPIFVFLGAWNPAIFQPGWVAHHLFEIPAGEKVKVEQQIQVIKTAEQLMPLVLKQELVLYIKDVGIAVTNERIRVYVKNFEDNTVQRAEEVAVRLFKMLPHTPFDAFGVNFIFVEDDPQDALFDALRTKDHIEENFKIIRQNFITTIAMDPDKGIVLNLSRQLLGKNVTFDFNYHHEYINVDVCEEKINGAIHKYFNQSKEIINDLYNIEFDKVMILDLEEAKELGEEQDAKAD